MSASTDAVVLSRYTEHLAIELVPATAWYSNLRSILPPSGWEACKRFVRRRSGDRCEVCGGRGPKWPVECHEIWGYDDENHVQVLRGLVALCPACHLAKHPGFASTQGKLKETLAHYARVNGVSLRQALADHDEAMGLFEERSRYEWDLDLTWLMEAGLWPEGLPVPTHR